MPPPPRRRSGPSGGPKGRSTGGAKGGAGGAKGRPTGGAKGRPAGGAGGAQRGSGGRRDDRKGGRRDDRTDSRRSDRRDDRRDDRKDGRGRSDGRGRDDERRDRGRGAVPPPTGRGARWGGLARRAAGAGGTAAPTEAVKGRLAGAGPSRAAEAFEAAGRHRNDSDPGRHQPDEILSVEIELVTQDEVRSVARKAVRRAQAAPEAQRERRTRKPPAALTEELGRVVGANTAPKLAARLADAGRAFEAERFLDAKRILTGLVRQAPASVAVRELHGLTLYRLGKWTEAAKELEAFRQLSGSTEQHPVLADCYRALRRYDEVEALWRELREVSPSAELVAEGRIVYAGSLADRGQVDRAIAEIEPAIKRVKAPRFHHLRLLYVLGDLYERAGDIPRARLLFDRVLAGDPNFGDAAGRRRQL